jgi:2',3'-cyclic-nucleotide 2'-phosphodiesterase (5'-nucleotidase family)
MFKRVVPIGMTLLLVLKTCMVMLRFLLSVFLISLPFMCVYSQHYALKSVVGERVEITKELDSKVDYDLISQYKPSVDSLMSPVLGKSAVFMYASRPESLLSNWVADVLVNTAVEQGLDVDMGLCNIGGLRSSMPKGEVTVGDIMSISPFDNMLCLLSIRGRDLLELFRQIARLGGEGVSSSLRMVITSDGALVSAYINGKRIKKNRIYNVVTIDYLAEGNDGMTALKYAVKCVETKHSMRDVLMDYIRRQAERGVLIDSRIEGRIVVMP